MLQYDKMVILPLLTFVILSSTLLAWFLLFLPVFDHLRVPPVTPMRCMLSVTMPSFLACYGLKKKSLNYSGAQAGFIVGFVMSMSSYSFMTSLIMFFIAGSKVTRWRSPVKQKFEEQFKEGGQRNWLQVICNGGVAAELALVYCIDNGSSELPIDFSRHYSASWLASGIIGALACSSGDTFASEVGSVVGKSQPRLITTLKKVPRGTNGAVSVAGTVASVFGGFLVALTFFLSNLLFADSDALKMSPPQWPVLVLGGLAGLVGSFIDSCLGATFQFSGINKKNGVIVEYPGKDIVHISGIPFFDNHNVNLLSSFLTALLTSVASYKFYEYRLSSFTNINV